jgi:hypothetical protein
VVTEVVSRNETVQVRVPRLITTNSTVSSRSEQPADVFLLLDGSGSMICRAAGCKYTMENWDLEKEAAIKMIAGMQQNLTNLTAGMAQFSIGSTVQAPVSSDLELVKTQINAQTLMQGGTDFGSPLAQCMDELLTKGQITKNPIRFCVLITDSSGDVTDGADVLLLFKERHLERRMHDAQRHVQGQAGGLHRDGSVCRHHWGHGAEHRCRPIHDWHLLFVRSGAVPADMRPMQRIRPQLLRQRAAAAD